MTSRAAWHLLSGEYPPERGGVSDYTRQLARGLADRGEFVHVWVPQTVGAEPRDPGVEVHRVRGLGPGGLREIDRHVALLPRPRRWFVQYVPTGLGLHGMNVPLIRWLCAIEDEVWVQFHEVALGWQLWRKPHHHLIHGVQLWMAAALARRAERIFISIEGWRPRLGREADRAVWLPIPSNIPVQVSPAQEASARELLGPGPWVAHFGTYGTGITRDLVPALQLIARKRTDVRFLLLGRGGERAAATLPQDRVLAPGELPASSLAALLKVATLALQPFPDGISARRTSAMGPLALGVPVVSTVGPLTDSVWHDGGVALALAGAPSALARIALELLRDNEHRTALGQRGAALYRRFFSLERTCEVLQGC